MRFKFTSRNRIFIGVLLIYACGVLFLLYHLMQDIDPRYRESAEDSMVETANLMASLAEQHTDAQGVIDTASIERLFKSLYQRKFSAQIFGVHKNKVELRAYIVNQKGTVLYDSTGMNTGTDFSRWRDVILALQGEYGARTTPDVPNNKETAVMYVSAPIYGQEGIVGAVAIGKPVTTYGQYISIAQNRILFVGIFSAVAIVILALIVAIWLTQPLGLVTEYVRYLRAQKSVNLPRMGRRALDLFAQGYENMRDALAGKHYVADYVQALTHELKSPLSAIRGATELLQEPMPEEQRQRFLHNIERETLRVQELVDHMMELTALEHRRSIKDPEIISLTPLLEELCSSAQAIAAMRNIQVQLNLPDHSAPLSVEGDRLLLHRALRNLLDNAIDFSPDAGKIYMALQSDKRTATITITDQGTGIPDYARERIFERFYSLTRPSSKNKSSGLGLAFVKEIVILHHGTIALRNVSFNASAAGNATGTIAELKLPLVD